MQLAVREKNKVNKAMRCVMMVEARGRRSEIIKIKH
jgi:hypothetical protein